MSPLVDDDWHSGILIAAAVQNLAIATMLWRAGGAAERRLALALLVLAGMTSTYALGWRGHISPPDWLALLPINLPLALDPLIWLYALRRTGADDPPRAWIHFMPTTIDLAYDLIILALPADQRHAWREIGHDHLVKPFMEFAIILSLAAYAIATLRLLHGYRQRLEALRSDADRHGSRWLRHIIAALLVTLAAQTVIRVYTNFIAEIDIGPYYLWLAAFSAWIGIGGWRAAQTRPPAAPAVAPTREERDWAALGESWRERLAAEGWWREPDLSLARLASLIGTNDSYLSRAFNQGLGMNFNQLVNRLRAEEVARAIEADPDGTADLLDRALDAGFSSKATFNRAFRDRYGLAPSRWRRRLKS